MRRVYPGGEVFQETEDSRNHDAVVIPIIYGLGSRLRVEGQTYNPTAPQTVKACKSQAFYLMLLKLFLQESLSCSLKLQAHKSETPKPYNLNPKPLKPLSGPLPPALMLADSGGPPPLLLDPFGAARPTEPPNFPPPPPASPRV